MVRQWSGKASPPGRLKMRPDFWLISSHIFEPFWEHFGPKMLPKRCQKPFKKWSRIWTLSRPLFGEVLAPLDPHFWGFRVEGMLKSHVSRFWDFVSFWHNFELKMITFWHQARSKNRSKIKLRKKSAKVSLLASILSAFWHPKQAKNSKFGSIDSQHVPKTPEGPPQTQFWLNFGSILTPKTLKFRHTLPPKATQQFVA